jgi:exopolyphosphatase/guanosine-5'-triphosphate,3'-diphosphate pyrophosphatase
VVGASVDLGSNSVHLLVAAVSGHRLESLVDESVFLGLGSAVVARGFLGLAARAELAETLAGYAETARSLGAEHVTLLGTEPIRRAADAARIVDEVSRASGAPLYVLSHEEEAYLTLIGVTEGMPVTHETLVVDIGGGSSEFCIVDATRPPRAAGLQVGSARLTDRFVDHDPPTATELATMRAAAMAEIRRAPDAHPTEIVAVGGTASNLLKIIPEAAIDRILTRERIARAEAILASKPTAVASIDHRVKPIRARLLPAGGAILDAVLERYGVDQIRVSDAGVREGTILAVEHAGVAWRDRLAQLAHGWRT